MVGQRLGRHGTIGLALDIPTGCNDLPIANGDHIRAALLPDAAWSRGSVYPFGRVALDLCRRSTAAVRVYLLRRCWAHLARGRSKELGWAHERLGFISWRPWLRRSLS